MNRRLLNRLTALSLLVCVAVAGLWVRGFWRADHYPYEYGRTAHGTTPGLLNSGKGYCG